MTDAKLQMQYLRADRTAITLPEWEEIDEREAIMHFDGGLPIEMARQRAIELYWQERDQKEGHS